MIFTFGENARRGENPRKLTAPGKGFSGPYDPTFTTVVGYSL